MLEIIHKRYKIAIMNEKQYIDWTAMSDKDISERIGRYVQHHRLEQNLSQDYVSKQAGISRSTLSLLERGGRVTLSTLIQVMRVLDLLQHFDIFQVHKTISPLAYVKLYKKERQRASGIVAEPNNDDLGW